MPQTLSVSVLRGIVLLGDIAVEFGYPALAVPLQQTITAEVVSLSQKRVRISLPEQGVSQQQLDITTKTSPVLSDIHGILRILYDRFPALPGMELTITGDYGREEMVTILAVALLKASLKLVNLKFNTQEMVDAVYQIGEELQCTVSKPAVAVSVTGQSLVYQEAENGIQVLRVRRIPLQIVAGDTLSNAETVLTQVKKQHKHHRQEVEALFGQVARLVEEGVVAIKRRQWVELGNLCNYHQKLLNDLGIGSDIIHQQCITAHLAGAAGAKMVDHGKYVGVILLSKPFK